MGGGMRHMRSFTPKIKRWEAVLVKSCRLTSVYGYCIADVLDTWQGKADTYRSSLDFAQDLMKACDIQDQVQAYSRSAMLSSRLGTTPRRSTSWPRTRAWPPQSAGQR